MADSNDIEEDIFRMLDKHPVIWKNLLYNLCLYLDELVQDTKQEMDEIKTPYQKCLKTLKLLKFH